MNVMKRRTLVLLVALGTAHPAGAESWPKVRLPEGIVATSVGQTIRQNGVPLRIAAFVSGQSEPAVADRFRQSFGSRRVEDRIGDTTIIGRAEGAYYLSVQLTPTASGTRGLVAVAPLAAHASDPTAAEPLSPPLADSRLLSDTVASDVGKRSRHLVYTNRHSASLNRELLLAYLKNRGYALERAVQPDGRPGETLFLRGPQREGIAVIARHADVTGVVLNLVSFGDESAQ